MEIINAVGRRKTAVARIYLKSGKGRIMIKNKKLNDYFTEEELQISIQQPLRLVNAVTKFDIKANLQGGGIKGQAAALRLAISRALVKVDVENRKILKMYGLLKRDPRKVERKKPGQPGARKKFQFSKR